MKSANYIAMVAILLGVSLTAFAKDKNETHVTFFNNVHVGSAELTPGDYKLHWDGSGPDVQVQVIKGKDVVATAPAKLIQGAHGVDSVTINGENGNRVDQVDFAGGRRSLVFGEAMTPPNATGGQQ